jgi:putative membrane protein
MTFDHVGETALATLVFAGLGVLLFLIAIAVMVKMAPFSIRKEIEEDQNISVGIIMGAIILGLAMIVSAAIHG